METIIGFVVGYLAGSREGREGLDRLPEAWHGIRNSPEARKLAAEAVGVAELALRRAAGSGVNGVTDLLGRRAGKDGKRAA